MFSLLYDFIYDELLYNNNYLYEILDFFDKNSYTFTDEELIRYLPDYVYYEHKNNFNQRNIIIYCSQNIYTLKNMSKLFHDVIIKYRNYDIVKRFSIIS